MRIIAKSRLEELARRRGCLTQASRWYRVASEARWENIVAVRKTFPTADPVGRYTVFNIGGNTYRLIVIIAYDKQTIYIQDLLTHAEYDKGRWKGV